jgi:hypothetical protein
LRTRSATSPSFVNLQALLRRFEQNLLEPHGICGERADVFLGVDDQAVFVLLGELSRGADDLVDEARHIDRLWIEIELAGLDLREVQHLVDEAQEVGAGGIHAAQRLQRLLGAKARRVGDHHLGQADNGVKRRAQLVAHAREELRLVLARHFELAALIDRPASICQWRRCNRLCKESVNLARGARHGALGQSIR